MTNLYLIPNERKQMKLYKLNKDQAKEEFYNLILDDIAFKNQWYSDDTIKQEKNFYEWCSLYEDTKHIKPK
tara:strand:- start:141 stop:353 length:213 start_codon:yes stop_codon:yes gene_type:complete